MYATHLLARADYLVDDLIEERRKLPGRPGPRDEDDGDRSRRQDDEGVLRRRLTSLRAETPLPRSNKTAHHGYLLSASRCPERPPALLERPPRGQTRGGCTARGGRAWRRERDVLAPHREAAARRGRREPTGGAGWLQASPAVRSARALSTSDGARGGRFVLQRHEEPTSTVHRARPADELPRARRTGAPSPPRRRGPRP